MKLRVPISDLWPINGFPAPDWARKALAIHGHLSAMGNQIPTRKIQYPVVDIPPWQDSRTIRAVANTRGLLAHPDISAPYGEWVVELARFDVPSGQIGIVKGFEQFLAVETVQVSQLFTASARWGVPFGAFGLSYDSPLNWRFRLSRFNGTIDPWFDGVSGSSLIPGQAYNDMPSTPDLWYPAGSAASQNCHFQIPGGNSLRVFLHSSTSNQKLQAACHLKGFRISEGSPEARDTIRTAW